MHDQAKRRVQQPGAGLVLGGIVGTQRSPPLGAGANEVAAVLLQRVCFRQVGQRDFVPKTCILVFGNAQCVLELDFWRRKAQLFTGQQRSKTRGRTSQETTPHSMVLWLLLTKAE